jgi:outer membrane protein OmpA-like peptidoglycan-associated protein
MGALDSARPDTLTALSFAAAIGDYTKLSYEGELSPLSERMTLYGNARIESLDMPELAGYQAQAIGYVARSGSLNADLDLKIEQDILDSVAHLKVRRLDLERVVAPEDDEFTADLGVPMDTAIGLLKDDNGLIDLEVPIEGDLADLSVGIGDALRKVWAKGLQVAMTHAATTFFAPILPVIAVSKLVGMANKIRFEPVAFPRGSAELAPDQSAYLEEMAGILNERPEVDVTLCGVALPDELTPAAMPAAAGATADSGVAAEAPTPADEATLMALGESRDEAVKESLFGFGVEPGRLVSCAPTIDPEPGAEPRVEIGI